LKFKCSQKDLSEALSIVQKAVPTSTPHPILEGIFIETHLDVLRLKATNTEITIETHINADIEKKGSIIVPSKMFTDIIRKLPDTTVSITVENLRVKIEYHNSIVHINSISGEYPEIKEEETSEIFEFKQEEFKKMIQKTVFAAAVSDIMRPEFSGVLLRSEDEYLTMVCIDGFRLALCKAETKTSSKPLVNIAEDVIIPAKALSELAKILAQSHESMDISLGKNHIVFDLGNVRFTTVLISGKFVDYNQVVHNKYTINVKIDKDLLYKSLDRATVFARDDKNYLVEFRIKEDKLLLSSMSVYGDIHDEIPIILTGEELHIAFNSRYFMEALRVIEDSEINIGFIKNNAPCLIRAIEEDNYAYMILPVRTH